MRVPSRTPARTPPGNAFSEIRAHPALASPQGFYQANVARAVPLARTVTALVFEMPAWLT